MGFKDSDGNFHPTGERRNSGATKQQFLPPDTSKMHALPKTQQQHMMHRLHLFGSNKINEEQKRIKAAEKEAKEKEKLRTEKTIAEQKARIENYRNDLIRKIKESREGIENEKEILKMLEKGKITASELIAIEREIEEGAKKPTLPREITEREEKNEKAKQKRIEESKNITPITPQGSQTSENYYEQYLKAHPQMQEQPAEQKQEVKEEKKIDEEIKPNERESLFKIQATGEP